MINKNYKNKYLVTKAENITTLLWRFGLVWLVRAVDVYPRLAQRTLTGPTYTDWPNVHLELMQT
jgi:hypothetical protein